jgi:hypothetical protein
VCPDVGTPSPSVAKDTGSVANVDSPTADFGATVDSSAIESAVYYQILLHGRADRDHESFLVLRPAP